MSHFSRCYAIGLGWLVHEKAVIETKMRVDIDVLPHVWGRHTVTMMARWADPLRVACG